MSSLIESLTRLRQCGFQCRSFVDVGANVGDVAYEICQAFPSTSGTAIEPHPELQAKLTSRLANLQVQIISAAVSNYCGEASFRFASRDRQGDDLRGSTLGMREQDHVAKKHFDESVRVPVVTLNQLFADKLITPPDLLKLDVEGQELAVLDGASDILGMIDVLMLETTLYPSLIEHPTFAEVVAYLAARNYVLYDLADLGYRPYDGALMIVDTVFVRQHSALRAHPYWS